jgi:very-short-patch-repair endonuclease
MILFKEYKFSKYCSRSCVSSDTCYSKLNDWMKINPELDKNNRALNGRRNILKLCSTKRSYTELKLFDRIKSLFPKLTIISNKEICGYKPDILILELNLLIEVDGILYHGINNLKSDLNRDRILVNSGYKIRRLDSNYCNKLSDSDIIYLILNEVIQLIPYFDRIPNSELLDWKSNIYQTGPKFLLTRG